MAQTKHGGARLVLVATQLPRWWTPDSLMGYLEVQGSEVLIIFAFFGGIAIGMWTGFQLAKEAKQRRDARGRFIR